jgi:hypothetical protein
MTFLDVLVRSQPWPALAEIRASKIESRFAAWLNDSGSEIRQPRSHLQTTCAAPAAMVRLFDGHRLGEIARLVDVSSEDKRGVVREKL